MKITDERKNDLIKNYLDTVLELPWNEESRSRADIKKAEAILEKDHFGLRSVVFILHSGSLRNKTGIRSSEYCWVVYYFSAGDGGDHFRGDETRAEYGENVARKIENC